MGKGKAMARRKDALSEASDEIADDAVPGQPDPAAADPVQADPIRPDPVIAPVSPPPAPPRRPGVLSGVLGMLLGGTLAALGGFALAHFNVFGLAAPDQGALVQALGDRITLLEGRPDPGADLATLADRIAALESAPAPAAPDLTGIEERLAVIETLPTGGDASTAALAAKLAELERRLSQQPTGVDQAEVTAALDRLATAEAEAQARADEATAQAKAAAKAMALDRLRDAVGAGTGFEPELAALEDPDLQAVLAPHVVGVATLASLQADFPEAARLALQLDRAAATGDGWGARFVDFLAAQTGARSLTPQDGDSADAILSRAEFALSEGRLADAVTEVRALDPTLQAPFADWLARADARLAVLTALEGK